MTTALTPEQIKQRLRYMGQQYRAVAFARGGEPDKHYLEQAADCIEALEAELAACKQDAERYRWLRHEEGDIGNLYIGIDSPAYKNQWALSGEKADAAIDAAMAAQEKA